MDLTTNGSLVMDSVKMVQSQLDYLNGMEKKLSQVNNNNKRDRELEEQEDNIIYDEEQQRQQKNTTNGIF